MEDQIKLLKILVVVFCSLFFIILLVVSCPFDADLDTLDSKIPWESSGDNEITIDAAMLKDVATRLNEDPELRKNISDLDVQQVIEKLEEKRENIDEYIEKFEAQPESVRENFIEKFIRKLTE